jgi:hypothetical protein
MPKMPVLTRRQTLQIAGAGLVSGMAGGAAADTRPGAAAAPSGTAPSRADVDRARRAGGEPFR